MVLVDTGRWASVCTMRSVRVGVVLMTVDVRYSSVNGAGGRQVMSGRQGAHQYSAGLPTSLQLFRVPSNCLRKMSYLPAATLLVPSSSIL